MFSAARMRRWLGINFFPFRALAAHRAGEFCGVFSHGPREQPRHLFLFDKMLSFSKVFNLTSWKRDIGFQCSRRWFTIESCGGGFRPAVAIV
jgi:hypothetical protein|tara:strand:- start:1026 stop:1301 length:276 start_codon:yes stop_codon:yes gene_type:complete